jgi:outer membrane protein assembly factor BamE (lipoprotein component of BamABCDE complex)
MKNASIMSLLVSATLISLCGCASDQNQKTQESPKPKPTQPAKDNRPIEDRLKVGMTKDEVREAIGNPKNLSTNSDGSEVWTYSDSEKAFIPFYTLSGGKFHLVIVNFDPNGKVKSWSTGTTGAY